MTGRHRRCSHSHCEFSVTWANQRDIRAGDSHGSLAYLGTMSCFWHACLGAASSELLRKDSPCGRSHCPGHTSKASQSLSRARSWGSIWSERRKRAFVEGLGLKAKATRALLSGCNRSRRRWDLRLHRYCKQQLASLEEWKSSAVQKDTASGDRE